MSRTDLRILTLDVLSPDHAGWALPAGDHFGVLADLAVPDHPPGRWI